ncbi:MAG: type VI secretion system ImpA family N-terminal domain-containing protein [Pseudomonadota bacterium]|nr:type VI secretion system ImpA family N-terminal domain-containing protein [Pseudomonadota bacterium]
MNIDDLLVPVSDDQPCGPDLYDEMDSAYDDYVMGAESRLPPFYFRAGMARDSSGEASDTVFKPADVDIDSEEEAIDALLKRSRDIRLLVLRAQWENLAGRLEEAVTTIEAIAALLDTFPDAVHPNLSDGSGDRSNALDELDAAETMLRPLQFFGLTGSRETSLRRIQVAKGDVEAVLVDERALDLGRITGEISSPRNRATVDTNYALLQRYTKALDAIVMKCIANPTESFKPRFPRTKKAIEDMLAEIVAARPDLADGTVGIDAASVDAPDVAEGEAVQTSLPQAAVPTGPAPDVVSHRHAIKILMACETYFRTSEPSSAALPLITQARLLIGRPLSEAIQTLLPNYASQAVFDFGPSTGFAIGFDRIATLSSDVPDPTAAPPVQGEPEQIEPMTSATTVVQAVRSVEDYFRRVEKSSPVPILLQRARGYQGKDFQAIVAELLPNIQ